MSVGRYNRWYLHAERKRRVSVLLQKSENGIPCYVESADFTDMARITRKAIRRVADLGLNGVHGASAWELKAVQAPLSTDDNFLIGGGDNTDLGAKEAWVSGNCALLYRDVDYQCILRGDFNETDAFDIHHRASSVADGTLVDLHTYMRVNALTGQWINVVGAGLFEVASNTTTTLTLNGFVLGDYPDLPATPWYYIALAAPVADMVQDVYLDLHLEDWGMAEDAALDHNSGGTPVECARREVLIQRVWVQQNPSTVEMLTSNYKDTTGTQHYVMKIGSLVRAAGNAAIADGDPVNDRNNYASVAEEVADARNFAHFDVGVDHNADGLFPLQPISLPERLAREDSWIVVGPDGDPGIYSGPSGLRDALALPTPHTIFLRNGVYLVGSTGTLVVPDRWTIIGESRAASIIVDPRADVAGVELYGRAELRNLTVASLADTTLPTVRVVGRQAVVRQCWLASISDARSCPVLQVREVVGGVGGPGGALIEACSIRKRNGSTVSVDVLDIAGLPVAENRSTSQGWGVNTEFNGSNPMSSQDLSKVDSRGVTFRGCRINAAGESGDNSGRLAAVQVVGGASVLFDACTVRGDGCSALRISGVDDDTRVGRAIFSKCEFLANAVATTDFASVSLVSQVGGNAVFENCTWDGIGYDGDTPGPNWPHNMLSVSLGTAGSASTGSTQIRGGRVLALSGHSESNGLLLRVLSDNTRVEVEGLTVKGIGNRADVGVLVAASAIGDGSGISLKNVTLAFGPKVRRALHMSGHVQVSGLFVDGTRSALQTETFEALDNPSMGAVNICSTDFWGMDNSSMRSAPTLRGVEVIGFSGAAVVARGVGPTDLQHAIVDGLVVQGERNLIPRTSFGVFVDRLPIQVSDSEIRTILFSAVFDKIGCAGGTHVNGLKASEFGLLFFTDGVGFSTVHTHHLAATSGCRTSLDVRVEAVGSNEHPVGHVGVAVWGGSPSSPVRISGELCNLGYGVLAGFGGVDNQARVEISNLTLTSCVYGLYSDCSSLNDGRLVARNLVFTGCGREIHLRNCTAPLLSNIVLGHNSESDAITLESCPSAVVQHLVTQSVSSQTALVLRATYCDDLLVSDVEADRAQGPVVSLVSCNAARIQKSRLLSSYLAPKDYSSVLDGHGLQLAGCTNFQIQDVEVHGGLMLQDVLGTSNKLVRVDCVQAGCVAWPRDGSASEIVMEHVTGMGHSASSPASTAGAWLANPVRGLSWWADVKLYDCNFEADSGNPGTGNDLTANSLARTPVLAVKASRITVERCRLNSTTAGTHGLTAVLGELDYIKGSSEDAVNHRLGVDKIRFVGNTIGFKYAPVVLVLGDGLTHDIRDNMVLNGIQGQSGHAERYPADLVIEDVLALHLYSEADPGDGTLMARAIYTGNQHELSTRSITNLPNNLKVVASKNVILDANLLDASIAAYPQEIPGRYPTSWMWRVGMLNTIWSSANFDAGVWILPDGTYSV